MLRGVGALVRMELGSTGLKCLVIIFVRGTSVDGGEPGTSRSSMTSEVFASEPGSRLSETGTGTEKTDKKGARRGRFQVKLTSQTVGYLDLKSSF